MWRIRLSRGWSQADLAVEAGYTVGSSTPISDLERDLHDPRLATVDRIAAALGVTAAELIRSFVNHFSGRSVSSNTGGRHGK
jgi:transcriptional regulator with XRE-family HTH domain